MWLLIASLPWILWQVHYQGEVFVAFLGNWRDLVALFVTGQKLQVSSVLMAGAVLGSLSALCVLFLMLIWELLPHSWFFSVVFPSGVFMWWCLFLWWFWSVVRCFCRTNGKVETGIFCVMVVPRVVTLLSSLSCLLCGVCHCECCFLCGVFLMGRWGIQETRKRVVSKKCVQEYILKNVLRSIQATCCMCMFKKRVQEKRSRSKCKKHVQEESAERTA